MAETGGDPVAEEGVVEEPLEVVAVADAGHAVVVEASVADVVLVGGPGAVPEVERAAARELVDRLLCQTAVSHHDVRMEIAKIRKMSARSTQAGLTPR